MDEKSREEVKTAVAKRLQEQAVKKHDEEAQANLDKGEAFLAENAKKDGVMTTDSGLQYEVMTAGEGDNPTAQDKVTVNYKGTLIDGTVFDSSYDRGEPVTFPLSNVIKGWTEGVQLMKPGAKYKFFIPSELPMASVVPAAASGRTRRWCSKSSCLKSRRPPRPNKVCVSKKGRDREITPLFSLRCPVLRLRYPGVSRRDAVPVPASAVSSAVRRSVTAVRVAPGHR